MVCRSERCLGSMLKHIKSNKDDPILITMQMRKIDMKNQFNMNHCKLYI
uniref:Uncharacterized protein n=1 Tax=Cucumis melo TaxID=3656 RepID=A0A9I9EC41_CUCME